MDIRAVIAGSVGIALAACSTQQSRLDPAWSEIAVVPDRTGDPRTVLIEVPTGWVMGFPGDRVPLTLQARASTREIAARELAAAGYCPRGFTGPDELSFPGGDRSRTAFLVRCL